MSQFNVCIIKPHNYIHSLAFLELGELITYSLRDLGHTSNLVYNKIEPYQTNIIIGCHLIDITQAKHLPKDTIVVNTEQINSSPTIWNNTIIEWVNKFQTWDYSVKNIEAFKLFGIHHVQHLRIGYQKELNRIKPNNSKDIDVLFYGCINERRQRILNNLISAKVRLKSLFGIYGRDRDKWIERSKLIINIHYYESQIFEIIRTFYLFSNSVPVISEVNKTTSIESIYKPAIKPCEYNYLTSQTIELIQNPVALHQLGLNSLTEISKHPQKNFTESLLP